MTKDTKRSRGPKWSHDETLTLAELKKVASLSNETGDMWKRISQQMPRTFPRSDNQCRWRWDTLVKVYKKIELYCDKTGKDHCQLNDEELASLKLDTEYQRNWYSIVQEVIRSKERRGWGMSNGSNTGSHSGSLPEHSSPARDTLAMPPQASTGECSSADNPSFEVLKNRLENTEWVIEGSEIKIPSEDETRIVPRHLERECPSHHQQCGAVNIAGGMGINKRHEAGGSRHAEGFDGFEASSWDTNESSLMATYLSQDLVNLKISTVPKSTSIVLDETISGQASRQIIQELEAHSDLQSDSEEHQKSDSEEDQQSDSEEDQQSDSQEDQQSDSQEEQQSQPCALQVIELEVFPCCDSCIRKWTKKLEDMDGVEKPVVYDRVNMKVSVTATAEPEDVLRQVQLVKKDAVMWPHHK